jgi:hypothetical protein
VLSHCRATSVIYREILDAGRPKNGILDTNTSTLSDASKAYKEQPAAGE